MKENLNYYHQWCIIKELVILRQYEIAIDNIGYFFINNKSTFDLEHEDNLKSVVSNMELCNYGLVLDSVNNILIYLRQKLTKKPCFKSWDSLLGTDNENIKFCLDCGKNVYLVEDELELIKRAKLGQCLAFIKNIDREYLTSIESAEPYCHVKIKDELLGDF